MQKFALGSIITTLVFSGATSTFAYTDTAYLDAERGRGARLVQTIKPGEREVTILTVDLWASCDEDRKVDQIVTVYEGSDVLPELFVRVNGEKMRMSPIDPKTLTATLTFEKPLIVKACYLTKVTFFANTPQSAKPGSTYTAMVELKSDIVSDAEAIYGNFPIRGTKITVVDMSDRRSCYAMAGKEETSKARNTARAACRRK